MCESSSDILTPATSYLSPEVDSSDSILTRWKEIHLAHLKGSSLLQGGGKRLSSCFASHGALPLPTHRSHQPWLQRTSICDYKITHLFLWQIQRRAAYTIHFSSLDLLSVPAAFVWWGRHQVHLWIEKIIGFGKLIDGSVWPAKLLDAEFVCLSFCTAAHYRVPLFYAALLGGALTDSKID